MTTLTTAYRPAQIWLHWITVFGVIFQIAFHDAIVAVIDARQAGQTPTDSDMTSAMVHVSVGSIILLAVIARLYLRWRYGAPGHAAGTSAAQAMVANIMHKALYGLLFAMVVTGMLTWNDIAPLGDVHSGINMALFFAALAHGFAAIFNQFVRKDGTLARMMPMLRKG
jgi:cytochrome b561